MTRSLTMDITIKATPERVFDAWVTPKDLVAWWGHDDMYRTSSFECDLRPGGKWLAQGITKEGHPFSVKGEYVRVDRPRELAFTWDPSWDSIGATTVEIEFEPVPGGTRLVLKHSGFPTEESCQSHNQGWTMVLSWLTNHVQEPNS